MKNVVALLWVGSVLLSQSAKAESHIQSFIGKYCIECHGSTKQKSDRRFDTLPEQIESFDSLERYQEIIDQLNLESMPPENAPQPLEGERLEAINQLTEKLSRAHRQLEDSGGHSVLRRINAWEYRHTIGDLLGINVHVWNPSADFPEDIDVSGFDNNGSDLVTSGLLMDHYFTAAEEAIRRSTHFEKQPESKTYSQTSPFYFQDKSLNDLPKLFQTDRFRFVPSTPYTDLYGRHYRGGHIGFLPLVRAGGVPASGFYTIRVKAAAVGRLHDYEAALDDFRNGDPIVMEVAAVDRRGSVESSGNVSDMTSLACIELTNEQPRWFEWTVFIESGYEPEIRFRNGPMAAKRLVRMLRTKASHRKELKPFIEIENALERSHSLLQAYEGPRLRVWEINLEGPHMKTWPPDGHRVVYGDLSRNDLNAETIKSRLKVFAQKAFRRDPLEGELDPIQYLVTQKQREGMSAFDALQLGCEAILCSPGFLFINLGEGALDDTALASRLSYFLWSSMPDDELLELAKKGTLKSNLRSQVSRMLADKKSDRFITHFVSQWLDLKNIGEMPPSEEFLEYYRDNLEVAMRGETETFFRHVVDNNLPPREFLEANYTFLNRELGMHYGIEGIQGNELRRVALPDDRRGGLLGQGAFLTASANGVDTSPVVRGVYVLEKILGYTPPPPPPDVPVIEPDIRGATSIRDQLLKHRAVATCAECHRKIDPLGFALEQYDAIGGWREAYEKDVPIDPAGQLPNGQKFESIHEFKKCIRRQQQQFARCLTEKLMAYALGRTLEIRDRPAVDTILKKLDQTDGGLHDLLQLIVSSTPFQSN